MLQSKSFGHSRPGDGYIWGKISESFEENHKYIGIGQHFKTTREGPEDDEPSKSSFALHGREFGQKRQKRIQEQSYEN